MLGDERRPDALDVAVRGDVEVRVLCHDGHVAAALRGVRGPAAVE